MKAAALYRVSTKKQVKGEDDSIAVQQMLVRKCAAEHGYDLVREYVEPGVSAYKLSYQERDIFQDALQDALAGEYEVLLVFKADRLSRNALEYPTVLWQLNQAGVEVISVAENRRLDIQDQMEKLIRFIEGWQAETESRNTSLRVSAVMRERAKQGHWSGGPPPYGFRLSERKGGLPLEIEPREAEILREMVRMCLEGMGGKVIARELNRRGIRTRTGRLWRDDRVRKVLQNSIIAGLPAYDRTRPGSRPGSRVRVRDNWNIWNPEIIIPRDEHGNPKPIPEYQIVRLDQWLEVSKAIRGRALNLTPDTRTLRGPALLTGFLRCGYCGRNLNSSQVVLKQRAGRKVYWYYRCITHLRVGAEHCGGKGSYSQKKIDQLVLAELEGFLGKIDLGDLERYIDAQQGAALLRAQKRAAEVTRELTRARQRLERWVERLNSYFADPSGSLYSEELMAREIRKAEEEVAALEKELVLAQAEAESCRTEMDRLARFASLAPRWLELFKRAPRQTQKTMLGHVIDRITVWEDRIEIHYRVSLADLGRTLSNPELIRPEVAFC